MIVFLNLIDTDEDKKRFTELYSQYKDLLYWIALKKVNNVEDAEECVQETFFYVAKNFNKIDDICSKKTKCYLSTIVTGFAIDIYNNSKKLDFVSSDEDELHQSFKELTYFEKYDYVELSSIIDLVLDEESKVLLYLKYIYGYKSKEIAQMYNVNDSYIRKKLQYAKDKLKNHLEGE